MKNEKLEKQASSEIAERLKKYKAEIFGNKPIRIGGIGWQHGDLIQLLELAERDTRERVAQEVEEKWRHPQAKWIAAQIRGKE